ncbi:MAG TPA: hypothetical protein VI431_14440 [Candidatus Acidoferrum sp.]
MKFSETSIENLLALGYTEDEARFLYLVATHSGYFSTRQYLQFTGAKSGEKSMSFTQKLLGKGHATARLLFRNGRVYHLFSRLVYRAIDREELRNRREHSVEYIRTKLTILDFVLAHLDYHYFETEAEKIGHFCSKLGISKAFLPAKHYAGAIRHKTTDHYFADRFPLFFVPESSSPPVVTFTFVDPGLLSLASFDTHLLAYTTLFSTLATVRFVYIATRETRCKGAQTLFLSRMHRIPNGDPGEEVLRYFSLRKLWEAKQFGSLTRDDMKFFDGARKRFNDAATDIRYQQWILGRVTSDAVRAEFRDLVPKQEVSFSTELVDGQAALFEARVVPRLARTVGTKVTQGMQATFGPAFKPPFGTKAQQVEEK